MNKRTKAEEERFVHEEEEWVEGDNAAEDTSIVDSTIQQIRQLRKTLPETSKTAKAIDEGAPWMEVSQLAEEEDLHQISNLLFEAEQQGLDD
uniref:Uncharacterized protein n=1 Tax=Candidatus Kentrum sp. LFY TaxID=2126342 RepID=A0A450X4W8_9GAMM|nr:MAG: hypothetical protein BECKLFY1418A_GA0070994_109723 [Candidatus Kentron sp. LFY]VFJ99587.1 MAG: hypothetical protein BECKLFY1418B_GA0070995_11507 [Candidatus Kentron sp. LFY]VFK24271.1 MAG: hypothetical protein BECKLFY1418C_GA0070996_11732 [Candidatus Kentron sp. LFY]